MTEQTYIIATDRVKITHAIILLRDTLPENNPAMDLTSYKFILSILKEWEDNSFKLIDGIIKGE